MCRAGQQSGLGGTESSGWQGWEHSLEQSLTCLSAGTSRAFSTTEACDC